ncbi:MAG: hypothetical protein KGY41_00065 [Desulfovermiculus sp.]|nr:hypothetical protein [Desulfovermiculus sp.]
MNTYFQSMILALILLFALPLSTGAAQDDDPGRRGELIHTSTVDSHELAYHLIDMEGAGAEMEAKDSLGGQKPTHHLMLYVTDPKGNPVNKARAGFLIKGPEGIEQKTMAMAMADGFGADISLHKPGEYSIKTKLVSEKQTLMDGFVYTTE